MGPLQQCLQGEDQPRAFFGLTLESSLSPEIVSRRLYSECHILSLGELEEICAETQSRGRTAGTVKLLMMMARRPHAAGVRFATELSQLSGTENIGKLLLDGAETRQSGCTGEAGCGEMVPESICLREKVRKLESELHGTMEIANKREKQTMTMTLMETALRLEKSRSQCVDSKCRPINLAWIPGPILPNAWDYLDRVVYSQGKVMAGHFLHPSELYTLEWNGTKLSSEWCEMHPVFQGFTPQAQPHHMYSLFTSGERIFGLFSNRTATYQSIAVYRADGKQSVWKHKFQLPFGEQFGYYHVVGDNAGKAYIVGGADTRSKPESQDSVFVYDLETEKLLSLERMKDRRELCSCVIVDNMLYVAGGEASGGKNSVEVMSLVDFSWRQLAPTPTYRSTLGVLCDTVISSGGTVTSEPSDASSAVSLLDVKTGLWLPLPPMNEVRDLHGHVTVDFGTLLAVGGMQSFGCVDRLATVEHLTTVI